MENVLSLKEQIQESVKKLNEELDSIEHNAKKGEFNKSALKRVRVETLKLEKLGKEFRKVSVEATK